MEGKRELRERRSEEKEEVGMATGLDGWRRKKGRHRDQCGETLRYLNTVTSPCPWGVGSGPLGTPDSEDAQVPYSKWHSICI